MNKIWTVYQQSRHLVITHSKVKKYVFNKNIIENIKLWEFYHEHLFEHDKYKLFSRDNPIAIILTLLFDIIPWGNVSR